MKVKTKLQEKVDVKNNREYKRFRIAFPKNFVKFLNLKKGDPLLWSTNGKKIIITKDDGDRRKK